MTFLGTIYWSPDYKTPDRHVQGGRTSVRDLDYRSGPSDPHEQFALAVANAVRNLRPGQTLTATLNDKFQQWGTDPYGWITVSDIVDGGPE